MVKSTILLYVYIIVLRLTHKILVTGSRRILFFRDAIPNPMLTFFVNKTRKTKHSRALQIRNQTVFEAFTNLFVIQLICNSIYIYRVVC